ncbi:PDZ domain-containing protein, partial [Haemophilus influenzae]
DISSSSEEGIVITDVSPNSPAAKSGIQVGDVILKLNNQEGISAREMMQIIANTKPNSKVLVTILRLGKILQIPVVIEEFPVN